MAETTTSNADRADAAPVPKKSSPVRLAILLVILGVLFVGLMVDMFVMRDSVNAAVARLNEAHSAVAARSVSSDEGDPWLNREGVQKAIGFAPTTSEVQDGRLVEQYRWWGALPLKRRYIVVFYDDKEGNRYSGCEVANGKEEEEKFDAAPAAPASPDGQGTSDQNAAPPAEPTSPDGDSNDEAKSADPAPAEAAPAAESPASETPAAEAKEDADKN